MSRSFTVLLLAVAALTGAACFEQADNGTSDPAEPGAVAQASQSAQSSPDATASRASAPRDAASSHRSAAPLSVPEGTVIEAKLDGALDSGRNHAGDAFTATVTKDVIVDGRTAIPSGSTLHGIVKSATAAKRGAGNASLTLAFNGLEMPDENSVAMVASFSGRTDSKKKHDAAVIGGGAAGGALLGRLLGGNTKGAVIGALAGGAAGTGVVMAKQGEQVKLPAGAALSLKLEQPIQVPRRS